MNKYSKRALKTTASVGMSLAMVLSGVAAPVMAFEADTYEGYTKNLDLAKQILAAIEEDLTDNTKKLKELPVNTTINWTKTAAAAGLGTNDLDGKTFKTMLTVAVGASIAQSGTPKIEEVLGEYVNYAASPNKTAKFLAGVKNEATATDTIYEKVDALTTALSATTGDDVDNYADGLTLRKAQYDDLKPKYDKIVAYYDDYKGNLSTESDAHKDLRAGYDANFADLEAAIDEYEGSFVGDISDEFVEKFKSVEIIAAEGEVKAVNVNGLVNGNAEFNYSNLETLEDFIKDLKDDKLTIAGTNVKYSKVSGEDDVIDLVEGLEAVVEDLKEVKELLKSTSATVKAYKGLTAKINTLANAAEAYAEVSEVTSTIAKNYRSAMDAFTDNNTEALTTYVDDVVSNFFTVEAVLRTSGNYTLRLKDADFARYVDETEVINEKLNVLLTTNLVKDEETSVYDSFAGNVDEADKLMAKVAAVEDIRIGSSFTSAEADTILAARKALNELNVEGSKTAEGYNPYGLSTKEIRTVKSNADLIDALYTKLILTGTITESGWVDKGAGNWDYINADGSKSTKWVAAGKDWYFVQNGTMLRSAWVAQDATGAKWYYVDNAGKMVSNTTIDGFVIDANGVWTK